MGNFLVDRFRFSPFRHPWVIVLCLVALPLVVAAQPAVSQNSSRPGATVTGEALTSTDSINPPLTLSFVRTDDSDPEIPVHYYQLQNVSGKRVSAYVIFFQEDNVNSHLYLELLKAGSAREITVTGVKGPPTFKAAPRNWTIDYVRFTDGTSWGKDVHGSADEISERITGYERAAKDMRALIERQDPEGLAWFLSQPKYTTPNFDAIEPPFTEGQSYFF